MRNPLSVLGMGFISDAFLSKISDFVIETVHLPSLKEKSNFDSARASPRRNPQEYMIQIKAWDYPKVCVNLQTGVR